MKPEEQVVSLELSKRLKELGVKQESLFYWIKSYEFKELNYNSYDLLYIKNEDFIYSTSLDADIMYSAFTTSELLALLPYSVDIKINEPFNFFRFQMIKSFVVKDESLKPIFVYIVNYYCNSTEIEGENAWLRRSLTNNFHDENPSNALAKMLIFLIENNLVVKNE
ncbi:MAG TPA: hypothetical protein VK590_06255 [Saprospiraceae bacterium]|nr:hypothetical protein [Saprospiraceae bacterium]